MQDWQSFPLAANAEILRIVDGSPGSESIVRIVCTDEITPEILAVGSETGIRKVITYPTLSMEISKISSLVQGGMNDGQKFSANLRKLRESGAADKVEAFIEEAYKTKAKFPEVRLEYANLVFQRGDLETAKTISMDLIRENKNNVRAMNILSRVCLKQGDAGGAAKVLEAADVLSPKNPDRLTLLGDAYFGLGENKKATEAYAESLDLDPSNAAAVQGLGKIKLAEGDSNALVELFNAHSTEAETAGFFNNAAVQIVKDGKYEEGLKLYNIALKALKSDVYKAQVHFNIALSYRKLKQYDKALAAIQESVKCDGKFEKAANQLKELVVIMNKNAAA
jgi:tetratricopeptide (TPR) repeat protein